MLRRRIANGTWDEELDRLNVRVCWPRSRAAQGRVDLPHLKEVLLRDRRISGALLTDDATAHVMIVQLIPLAELPLPAQARLRDEIISILKSHQVGAEGLHLVGLPIYQSWMYREVGNAVFVFFPMGTLILGTTMYLLYQRMVVVFVAAAVGVTAVSWGLAVTALVFGKLTILVAAAPLVILVISTSDVIHLTTAYRAELAHGLSQEAALRKVMREVGGACLLTSVTTFVGFLSLMAVPSPLIRHFALAAAIGVASALLLALTLVPLVYSLVRPLPLRTSRWSERLNAGVDQLVDWCRRNSLAHSRWIVLGCILLFLLSCGAAAEMRLDMSFPNRFAAGHPLRRSVEYFNQHLAGATEVELFLRSSPGQLSEPKTLRALAVLEERLTAVPEVSRVYSLVTLYRGARDLVGFETADGLPDTPLSSATMLKVFRQLDSEIVRALINQTSDRGRIIVRLKPSGYLEVSRLAERLEGLARQTLAGTISVKSSGSYPVVGNILQTIVRGQIVGLMTCFVGTSLILRLVVRSLKTALLAQFPNILPAMLLIGLLAVTQDPMDTDLLGIPTVALGLAVDDTIHFLHRYQLQKKRSASRDEALKTTFAYTGRSILQTTVILCLGLSPFAFSAVLSVWMLGTYLIFILLCAVLGDLLLLPAMIKLGVMD